QFIRFGYDSCCAVLLPLISYKDYGIRILWRFGLDWGKQRAASTTITTVPSLKMRNGDFSELLDPTNRYYGKVVTITDPTTGQPFAGNIIPANRVSANGLALLRAYPEPTAGFVGPG